ncbi:hypothetical protein LZ554_002626 [Drepanopeziza brunnea f. sp. 'monogermtubi']|nr:hypothetical protein LZ554_002626 [Drepanopeziza brunnea f. sp. 'monogermtubi']
MASLSHSKLLETLLPTPPRENLNTHFVLGEIIDQIDLVADDFPLVQIATLKQHLWDIRNHNVDPEIHLRGFLHVFKDTEVFKDAFTQLDVDMQVRIKAFMEGKTGDEVLRACGKEGIFGLPPSPPVKHHFMKLMGGLKEEVKEMLRHEHGAKKEDIESKVVEEKASGTDGYPRIFEDEAETKTMEVHANKDFPNWGRSVSNTPRWTFVPKSVLGLQNLVKWAKSNGFRVRCSGYRHSWSATFSEDKQILVSLLNLASVTKIPDTMSISAEHIDPENELKVIQLAAPAGTAVVVDKALVRVGVSVTNEQFRRWAVANDKWTLPVDVILVEVTFGGVNGPICHGAGRRHQTISDYVRAVEQNDLRHAPALQTRHRSRHPPPLSRNDIPIALRKTFTDAKYAAALADFKKRAQEDYYSEWFWYTRSQQAWVNTWNSTDDPTGSVEYPSPFMTSIHLSRALAGGDPFGTASIEVISIPDAVTDNEWVPFLQRVADLWMGYRDGDGVLLNVRPHWAKEWESTNMRGKPARQYLKEDAYRDAIPDFRSTLAAIGAGQGWELKDIQARFSNESWDYMIYS